MKPLQRAEKLAKAREKATQKEWHSIIDGLLVAWEPEWDVLPAYTLTKEDDAFCILAANEVKPLHADLKAAVYGIKAVIEAAHDKQLEAVGVSNENFIIHLTTQNVCSKILNLLTDGEG